MGCLLFKESKLNFLENLKTEEYINSRRELTFEKDVHKYLNDLVNRLNLNYDLNLKALATIKEVKIKTGKDFSRDSEKFILTPIEESFEQIDNRRKELGIYEDRISIGEYNKTQSEKISNQEERKNKYYQVNDGTIKKIEEPKSIDDLFNTLSSIENSINLITNSVLNNGLVSNYYLTQTNENRFKTVLEKEGISINQIDYITDFIKNNNLFNRKLSEIIGIINQEIILNSKGLNYYNAILKDMANEKLDGFLKDFLSSQLNVSVIDNMVNHYGSPMAVADILNKVIQINKKNLKTLPEETGHFFFELLGNQNALQKQLTDGVESWEGYQNVFDKYKTIYLKTNIKNEIVPDIDKIKREAVGQAIGEGLIRNFKAKEGDSFFSSLQKAIDYIKKLFADLGIFNFNSVVDDIAKDILNNDISKIKQIKDEHYKKRTYKETVANNPEILEIIENIQKLGGTLTGSLAYRDQGDLYRPDDELVHDLDFRIYYDVYNGDIQNFIEKITKTYPDVEYRRKSNGEIMTWTDSNGHTPFLLRKGEILIDLFFYPEQIKNENNKFSNWYGAFVEKYKMGRPKDMNDILRWSNFKQQNLFDKVQPFVYYQLEEREGGLEANLKIFSELKQELRVREGEILSNNNKILGFNILSENSVINKDVSTEQAKIIFNKKNRNNQEKKDLSVYFANYFLNSVYDKEGLLYLGYTRFSRYGITSPKLLIVQDNGRKNPFFQYNNVVIIGLKQLEKFINSLKTPSFEKFENLINTVAQEEIIHLYADYLLDYQDIDNIYNEMTEKDINQIKKIYGNSSIQKENIVHEYVRMVVQQRVFGKTTEYETFTLSNAIMSFFGNLLEELNDFLNRIIGSTNTQKAIEDVINFTKGNFSEELDKKIINRVFEKGKILESNLEQLNQKKENLITDSNQAVNQVIKPGVSELFESNPELANIGTQEQYSAYLDNIFPDSKVKDIVYHGGKVNKDAFRHLKNKEDYEFRNPNSIIGFFFSNSRKTVAHQYAQYDYDNIPADLQKALDDTRDDPEAYRFYSEAIPKKAGSISEQLLNIKNPYIVQAKEWEDESWVDKFNILTNNDREDNWVSDYKWTVDAYEKIKQHLQSLGYDGIYINSDQTLFNKTGIVDYITVQKVVFEPEQIHILSSKKDLEMFRNFINFTKSEYAKYGDIQQFKDYIMSKNFAAVEEFLVVNNKIDRKC